MHQALLVMKLRGHISQMPVIELGPDDLKEGLGREQSPVRGVRVVSECLVVSEELRGLGREVWKVLYVTSWKHYLLLLLLIFPRMICHTSFFSYFKVQ